jgi:folate-dependent phosphoribosylglycinamide formyltransferase PurN
MPAAKRFFTHAWPTMVFAFVAPAVSFLILRQDFGGENHDVNQVILTLLQRCIPQTPGDGDDILLFATRGLMLAAASFGLVLLLRRQFRLALFWAGAVGGILSSVPLLTEMSGSPGSYAFHSGTAMISMAVVAGLVLLRTRSRHGLAFAIAGALFVLAYGASTVYLRIDDGSDVLMGWSASLAWVAGLWLVLMPRPEHLHVPPALRAAPALALRAGGRAALRVVILSWPYIDAFHDRALSPLFRSDRIDVVGACVDVRTQPSNLEKVRYDLRHGRGGYVVVKAIQALRRRREQTFAATSYFAERAVPVLPTENLYGEETLGFIREQQPHCVVRTGFGILAEPILSIAPEGVISFHHGNIRRYRGIPPAFWELYNGEQDMGVTVQILAEKLDAGRIVHEISVPIHPTDSWRALDERACTQSEPMMLEACLRLLDDSFEPVEVPEDELGPLYTLPNLRQWSALQAKVAWRRARAALGCV